MGSAYQSAGGGGAGASPAGKSVPTIPASVAGASSPGLQCPIAACSGEQAGSAGAVSLTSGVQCPIAACSGGQAASAGILALVAPLGGLEPPSPGGGGWTGLGSKQRTETTAALHSASFKPSAPFSWGPPLGEGIGRAACGGKEWKEG